MRKKYALFCVFRPSPYLFGQNKRGGLEYSVGGSLKSPDRHELLVYVKELHVKVRKRVKQKYQDRLLMFLLTSVSYTNTRGCLGCRSQ